MRNLALCIVLLLPFVYIYSQDLDYYYLEINEGYELGEIQKTVNTDQTLTLYIENTALAAALNEKPVYNFDLAFPKSLNPRLQRVYLFTIAKDFSVSSLLNIVEIKNLILIDNFHENLLVNQNSDFDILPDDYDDIITGGRNTALDLIRAPLAWTVTTGDPSILIGVIDGKLGLDNQGNIHEDLQGQVIDYYIVNYYNGNPHGTGVTGLINAKTNNGMGISSIAHDHKVVFIETTGGLHSLTNGLQEIIHLKNTIHPNIRVVNCSWASTNNYPYLFETIYGENGLIDNEILAVAAAGNSPQNVQTYPSSYEDVIGVTGVGQRYSIGFHHDLINPENGNIWLIRSWKDVFRLRPHLENDPFGETLTYNDNVSISAPGHLLIGPTDNYSDFPSGYSIRAAATSPAAPFVTGVAALVFSANPNLTISQVKDIIENTADNIYHIPYNQPYQGLLGTGRLNAYRAVLTAKCMDDPNYIGNLDLMVRNSMVDYGFEPDLNTEEVFWNSQEIWVRHNSSESYIDVHQNPEYDPVQPNFVYVRVTNRSCITSSGNDSLELYWAKSHAAPSIWPDLWDGSISIDGVTLGGLIATASIPELTPGKEAIIEIPWLVPNPEDFQNISTEPWHFCLVARINSTDDPITNETSNLSQNVMNNNNFAWKNLNIVDIIPNTPATGSIAAVANPFNQSKSYKLVLKVEESETGKPIYEEAEVGVELDDVLFDAWVRGGRQGTGFLATSNGKKLIATEDNMTLDNLQFLPNEWGTAYITFNFLTKKLTNKTLYTYHVIQKDYVTNEVVGGVTYEIRKQPRPAFTANAGNDEEIDRSESVTLQASEINEDAVYNWYDVDGNLIYTGTTITVSPQFTQQYKLEVISNLDGLKDYDDLQVTVNPYKIQSLIPNPATSTVTVNYIADEATSAYLMVVHQNSGNTSNYIIDIEENSHIIDLSGFATGLYSIILVCDGEIQGSKNLIKN
jgi:subtilisin family serine protease